MKKSILSLFFICFLQLGFTQNTKEFIRINQLGYTTKGVKVAVWCSMNNNVINNFSLIDAATNTVVFKHNAGKGFGGYGPFNQTYRLQFSQFIKPGKYYIKAGNAVSATFKIDDDVYKGTADFCLQYMRQQRSGFNPFLNDSCHTHDGYVLYGSKAGIKDSTHINVVGGWHDASDYLQYSTTTANATYHLLKAYKDFKEVFTDEKLANGLQGSNGIADVLDEAKWGLDWLLKMHPENNILFNQLGDDRDHRGMRIPKEDNYYGKGFERPVYLVTGEPQQRGKFMNNTTGTSSTAAKFASAFTLGASLFNNIDASFSNVLFNKSSSSLKYALIKPGVTQTVSVLSPYIYAEDNWVDDMELAYATSKNINEAYKYAMQKPITPWLGMDTAKHYQWYPFINLGHYELAQQLKDKRRDTIISFYKQGIEKVFAKAKQNAFYRGIPFIWCSNNLAVSFAMQCYWYKQLTNNNIFDELEQANIDWLFGCNPWGTSMVYGLPFWGDTPEDPHSAFTHLKNYPINGGLVDGPVYTSIYKSLIGIKLNDADEYADFQSNLAVYHDDYGDYSTNEPTMDGTASLIYMLAAKEHEENINKKNNIVKYEHENLKKIHGAIVRGDSLKKEITLMFTADEFGEGLPTIIKTLEKQNIKASFFFTGNFYRNTKFQPYIKELNKQQHYVGPHSDKHLLYCDWNKRDSLLINFTQFSNDYNNSLLAMEAVGIDARKVNYFIPPYEWWNDSVAIWCSWKNIKLFSFTSGTKCNADYTWPQLGKAYASNNVIMQSIKNAAEKPNGLNGNILLLHAGTDPRREEKFYNELDTLITFLKQKGYSFKKVNELF
ncbi:MAG: glycoside hydrolase family 9 protein [Bacteroidetes bacterium]|nr:glycoside hydrolase family 9 protein [Bacteroidota bacterium]